MPVNPAVEGRSYPPAPAYVVSRAKIGEFARAVGATDEAHFDVAAAQARGYADVVAPPTFAVLISQQAQAAAMVDPQAGIDFTMLVHGEESFTHHRPLVAGDEVVATSTIDKVRQAGGHSMLTLRTDLVVGSEPVSTTSSVLVIRGES